LGLICTKLPGDLINCERLLDLQHAGLDRKLTLISAPAGAGKTTLIGEPVDQAGLIGVINHVNMLGLPLVSVECVSAPEENGPLLEEAA
jgi:hypothetical protein